MIRSSEYDKLELKHQNLVFTSLAIVCIIKKMSWCETEMQKYIPLVKQNVMKFEVFILAGQRIDQKRNKGWWRGSSRERIEMEAQKVTELTIEEDKEHLHLPLLVSSRCVSSDPQLDSAVKRCSSEVLKLSFQRGCSVKGLARRD